MDDKLFERFINRIQRTQIHQELLIKAIGKGRYRTILDTTAGLGKDGILMAHVADKIVLLERNPQIHQYLQALLIKLSQLEKFKSITERVTLIHQCALDYLASTPVYTFDVIYCDPMFPESSKSALPKQESQFLQQMVGTDQDVETLVSAALKHAKHRVVVKRPLHSPIIVKQPTHQYKARAHRFDVYSVFQSASHEDANRDKTL